MTSLASLKRGLMCPNGQLIMAINPLDLLVDPTYQRPLNNANVHNIAANFDETKLSALQVCRRKGTGKMYVVDGQHRVASIKKRHQEELPTPEYVMAFVTLDTTLAQEARKFVELNNAKPVTGNAKFMALLAAGSEPHVTIDKWVEDEGFVIQLLSPGKPRENDISLNGIFAVKNLLEAYNQAHTGMKQALKLLRLWMGNGDARKVPYPCRHGEVIKALAIFMQSQGDKDVNGIAQLLRVRNFNLADMIKESKKLAASGWDRVSELVTLLKGSVR